MARSDFHADHSPFRHVPKVCLSFALLAALLLVSCGQESEKGGLSDAGQQEGGIPKPEHPRPDFMRERWFNLNGTWEFVVDPDDRGEAEGWFLEDAQPFDRLIVVPFPWESRASGLDGALMDYRGLAWYRRTFDVPPSWGGRRVLLRFGAVDWSCKVWLNGRSLGEHEGGYAPFWFDITEAMEPAGNSLVVRVWDPSELDPQIPRGKQGGIWYTRASGIWQTVYLEAVPRVHVRSIRVYPRPQKSEVGVHLGISAPVTGEDLSVEFRLEDPERDRCAFRFPWPGPDPTDASMFTIPLEDQRLWSPEDPALYGLRVCLVPLMGEEDCVDTYFGQRWVSTDWAPGHSPQEQTDPREQYKYVYLNGEPVFIRGLLDQSYHPEGVYTYPDEDALKRDLLLAKDTGFNFLRIHIKIDEPRRLYWADRLGLLLMADIPCMDQFAMNTRNARCRPLWEGVMRRAVERDFNHPGLIAWCDFNETWGLTLPLPLPLNPCLQDWVGGMWMLNKGLDPTRLVEDHSPTDWFQDHVITDLNSWHFYLDDYTQVKKHLRRIDRETYPGSRSYFVGGGTQDGDPLLCSEYGPVSAIGGDRDVSWGFKYQTNELRLHPKVCGFIYTEITDVEWEHNGIFRYDRSEKEFGYEDAGVTLQDLTGPDFLVLHTKPALQVRPGSELSADVSVSLFSLSDPPQDAQLFCRFSGFDEFGQPVEGGQGGPIPVQLKPFGMSDRVTLSLPMPAVSMTGYFLVWAQAESSKWRVANYLPVHLYDGQRPRLEKREEGGWVLRWDPGLTRASQWSGGEPQVYFSEGSLIPEAVSGNGIGFMEYRLPFPPGWSLEEARGITFLAEVSAAVGAFNLQTDELESPSRLRVSLNGIEMGEAVLPDAPADSRGFLSYLHEGFPPLYGSYGYLVSMKLPVEAWEDGKEAFVEEGAFVLRLEVAQGEGSEGNGLRVYGDRLGRYALDPSLLID